MVWPRRARLGPRGGMDNKGGRFGTPPPPSCEDRNMNHGAFRDRSLLCLPSGRIQFLTLLFVESIL